MFPLLIPVLTASDCVRRQMGVKVVGELIPRAGCPEAMRRRENVPWTTTCRSTNSPLGCLFVNLWGNRPRLPGGAEYLRMVVDDFIGFACPYFLKTQSKVRINKLITVLQQMVRIVCFVGCPACVPAQANDIIITSEAPPSPPHGSS